MASINLSTFIAASPEVCFDLARNIDVHLIAGKSHSQRAVAGTTKGLIGLGETVTWEGNYLLLRRQMTSKIVAFDRPHMFADEMVKGAFHHWRHTHRFIPENGGTTLTDQVELASPFGPIGWFVDIVFMKRYMTRILIEHNLLMKKLAESSPT